MGSGFAYGSKEFNNYANAVKANVAAGQKGYEATRNALAQTNYGKNPAPSYTASNSGPFTSALQNQGTTVSSGLSKLLITQPANQDAVSKAGEIVNQDQSKTSTLSAQLKRLMDEKEAKTQVWENGIYMGENKELAQQYDTQIAEVRQQLETEQQKQAEAAKPKTSAARDEYIRQLNELIAYEGYATTVEQADAVNKQKNELRQKLHEEDQRLGNAARFYDSGERNAAIIKGGLGQIGSAYTNLLGTIKGVGNRLIESSNEFDQRVAANPYSGWATDPLTAANIAAGTTDEQIEQGMAQMLEDEQSLYQSADTQLEKANAEIAQAKEGLSGLGQFGVDAATTLIQLGADAAGSATGLGMLPMFARAAGSSMQEARQAGASTGQQVFYGLTKGAIEAGTEKLFDGVAGLFGRGVADDVVESVVKRLADSDTGRTVVRALANATGEGTEEAISDLLDPFAKLIYNDQALREAWENRSDLASDMLYDYLLGFSMGGLGSVTSVATGQDAAKNAELRAIESPAQNTTAQTVPAATQTGATAPQTVQTTNANMPAVYRVLSSGRVNNTMAETIAADPGLSQAFTAITGIELTGTTNAKRTTIQQAARDLAYRNSQVNAAVQAHAEAETQLAAQERADQQRLSEQQAAYAQQQAQEQAVRNSGYDSYIRGMALKGMTVADAREILRNPELKSTWERLSGIKLPGSSNRAVDIIRNTRLDVGSLPSVDVPTAAQTAQEAAGNIQTPGTPQNASTAPTAELNQTQQKIPGQELLDYGNSQQTATAQSAGADLLNYGKGGQNNTAPQGAETVHVVERLRENIPQLSEMPSVASTNSYEIYAAPGRNIAEKARALFERIKGVVARPGFGDVEINTRSVKDDLSHGVGVAKASVIPSIPNVIKKGTQIDFQENWKGRPYDGYVFAAPVELDGKVVYVAAVVKQTSKNRFYLHEVVDSEGNIIKIKGGETANPTSLASVDDAGAISPLSTPESNGTGGEAVASPTSSIPSTAQNVNTETGPNMRERGFSQNIRTDENMEAELRRQFEDSPLMYQQLSNADTLAKAQEIYGKGLEEATAELNKWIGEAKAGRKMPPEAIPLSRMIANELTRQGRVQEAVRIESDIAAELTLAGQYAQAARILRDSSSPAAKAMFIENLVSSLNSDLTAGQQLKNRRRGMGDETGRIVVDDALLNEYANATTDEASNAAIDKINQSIAQQMPATFSEKFTAMRYVNMLGNLKTQGRNVGGNVLMLAATMAKRRTQAAIESLASAATGGKVERTTSFGINKDLYKAGIEDANAIMDTLQGDAKYSDSRRVAIKGIQDRRQIFNSKILEGYRKATNWAMEAGDRVFLRANYADAFQGYLSAHGIKDISEASPEVLNAARTFAIREAQEATFRDSNKIADWVSSLGRGKNTPKAVQILGEGVMPFRKTPANVGIRAVEYSPLGVAETIYKAVQTKKGNATATDVINSASKNIVGTSLAVAGYLLAASGDARGTEDDDELAYFQNMRGAQDYSIRFGDEYISLSQLAPTAVPFFMGVELYNALEDGGASLDTLMKIPGAVTGPLLEMSMLSGINDTLADLTTYGGDGSALPKLFANTTISYMTQFLTNSLAGQAEQASEEYRQTTYSQPGNKLGSFQYALGQAAAKTPGVDYNQQDYIDQWGRRQSNGPLYERLFNAFLNPVYTSTDRSTEVDAELERLYTENKDLEGFPSVLPQKASRSLEYTKGVVMTPEEYQQYSIDRGQMSLKLVSDFMQSAQYKDMDDQSRAEVISNLYSLAADRALKKVKTSNGVEYTGNYDDIAKLTDIPAYMASKTILSQGYDDRDNFKGVDNVVDSFYSLPEDVQAQLKDDGKGLKNLLYANKLGIGSEQYYNLYDTIKEMNEKTADSSDVATAVTIASAIQGTDEDKLNALKAMILPAKGTGKTASTVRRFEAALSYGQQYGINITYDDWAEFEAKVKEVDENGSVSKADLFAAWAESNLRNKIDKNTARKIYNTYKDDEAYVDMYDEDYAAEYPVEEKEPEIGTYDWLMNQFESPSNKPILENPLLKYGQGNILSPTSFYQLINK